MWRIRPVNSIDYNSTVGLINMAYQALPNNAQAIRDVLLNSSEQALADQQNQQLTQSFCDDASPAPQYLKFLKASKEG